MMLLYLLTLSSTSYAAEQGAGRVRMQGSIIDTPCAIDIESRDQSIDMSVIPIEYMIRNKYGPEKQFSIHLENCVLEQDNTNNPDWSSFRITFDGPTNDGTLFSVRGHGTGVGLQLSDNNGNIAFPGKQMPPGNLIAGNMTLDYKIRLKTNHKILRAGAYRATLRFKMDYY